MSTKLELLGMSAFAIAAGTVYVLVHEARRKRKKAEKAEAEAPISKDMLLAILRLKPNTTVKDLISAGLKAGAKGSAIKDLLSPRTSGRKRNLVRPTPLMVPPPVAPKLAEDAGAPLQGRRRDGRASRRAAVAPYRSPKGSEGVPSLGGLGKPGSPSGLTPTMSGASLSIDDLLDQRGTAAA